MRTIKTTVTVTDDQQITITLPSDIIPGKHRVVLVIDEIPLPLDVDTAKPALKLNVGEWKNWSPECNFRREDIYDDDRV
jgi:hypothetical protein